MCTIKAYNTLFNKVELLQSYNHYVVNSVINDFRSLKKYTSYTEAVLAYKRALHMIKQA